MEVFPKSLLRSNIHILPKWTHSASNLVQKNLKRKTAVVHISTSNSVFFTVQFYNLHKNATTFSPVLMRMMYRKKRKSLLAEGMMLNIVLRKA